MRGDASQSTHSLRAHAHVQTHTQIQKHTHTHTRTCTCTRNTHSLGSLGLAPPPPTQTPPHTQRDSPRARAAGPRPPLTPPRARLGGGRRVVIGGVGPLEDGRQIQVREKVRLGLHGCRSCREAAGKPPGPRGGEGAASCGRCRPPAVRGGAPRARPLPGCRAAGLAGRRPPVLWGAAAGGRRGRRSRGAGGRLRRPANGPGLASRPALRAAPCRRRRCRRAAPGRAGQAAPIRRRLYSLPGSLLDPSAAMQRNRCQPFFGARPSCAAPCIRHPYSDPSSHLSPRKRPIPLSDRKHSGSGLVVERAWECITTTRPSQWAWSGACRRPTPPPTLDARRLPRRRRCCTVPTAHLEAN
jgi:hypothetical protein